MRYVLCFLLFPLYSAGQNLLVNSGFEKENICIEFKVNCAPEAWIYSVPSFIHYFKNATQAHSDQHYVALIAGHTQKRFYRTFIRTPLLCGLQKGNRYQIELYVRSRHSLLDSIGIYFTPYDFLFEKSPHRNLKPSLYAADAVSKPVKNDTSWQKITWQYVASGSEAFLTIGNFSRRDVGRSTGIDKANNFFFMVDDVRMMPIDPREKLCSNWEQRQAEILAQTERHEYQERLVKEHRSLPYHLVSLPATALLRIDTVTVPDVMFATNQSALKNTNTGALLQLVQQLRTKTLDSVVVEGHTDNTGTAAFNQSLSAARAASVAAFLQQHLAFTSIITRGCSSSQPAADNETAAGRRTNRRVEIYFYVRY